VVRTAGGFACRQNIKQIFHLRYVAPRTIATALKMCIDNLPASVRDLDDRAQSEMTLAATYAGVGFGNAGVHLWYGRVSSS